MRRFQQVILVIMLLLIATFILIFILENDKEVTISFMSFMTPSMPIAAFIVTAFLIGLILAFVVSYIVLLKMRIKLALTNKQLIACKKELAKNISSSTPQIK